MYFTLGVLEFELGFLLARLALSLEPLHQSNLFWFFLVVVLEFDLQDFVLARQALYCLNHISSPTCTFFFFAIMGNELRALHMVGKYFATEIHPQSFFFF
jgi:hypothetical protein